MVVPHVQDDNIIREAGSIAFHVDKWSNILYIQYQIQYLEQWLRNILNSSNIGRAIYYSI